MKISVVIPAYNEEKYIARTLSSLHRQTRKPDEILVVDGNSNDHTKDVAKKFNVRIISSSKRGTIGSARQTGLEKSTGDIVACTDADTAVPEDWIEKIENTLTKKGVVAVYGDFRIADGWLPYRIAVNYINPILFSILPLFGLPSAIGQNIAFLRSAANSAGGFPKDFQSAEDHEIIKKLSKIGTVVYRRDICVISSGRRGNEGLAMIPRKLKGMLTYYITGKADTFTFPDIR